MNAPNSGTQPSQPNLAAHTYRLVKSTGDRTCVEVTPVCAGVQQRFNVAEVLDVDSPNPLLATFGPLGLNAVEEICRFLRLQLPTAAKPAHRAFTEVDVEDAVRVLMSHERGQSVLPDLLQVMRGDAAGLDGQSWFAVFTLLGAFRSNLTDTARDRVRDAVAIIKA